MYLKKLFLLFIIVSCIQHFNINTLASEHSDEPVARILRQGRGEINIKGLNGSWPEGYSFKKKDAYKIQRLEDSYIPKYSEELLKSWSANQFTFLKNYKEGETLSSFKTIVHGLELKHLVEGLDTMSFDDFVRNHLNKEVPLGDNFIPYYPYFFHKKTIISASVICENLTATFGNAGFVLTVPPENFLYGSDMDIHTPTDKDFYMKSFSGDLVGENLLIRHSANFSLPPLNRLLPKNKIKAPNQAHIISDSYASVEEYNDKNGITEKEIRSALALEGEHKPTQERVDEILKMARSIFVPSNHLYDKKVNLGQKEGNSSIQVTKEESIYNEISINPSCKKDGKVTTPLITGVFLRTSEKELSQFIEKNHIKKLLQTAEAFDLPVLLINDGNKYETNL